MNKPSMIVVSESRDRLKEFELRANADDVNSEMGEFSRVIKIENFPFKVGDFPLFVDVINEALEKYDELKEMFGKDVDDISKKLNMFDLSILNMQYIEKVDGNISDEKLFSEFSEFFYDVKTYEFSDEFNNILSNVMDFKKFKEKMLERDDVIKVGKDYLFIYDDFFVR